MKVVLFCGGQGMRLRPLSPAPLSLGDHDTGDLPKPMVPIGGQRPLMWHVMKYYAHFGHKDFLLCLGYRGEVIKDYFLHYDEYRTNDFVMTQGGKSLDLLHNDIEDWRITFLDTGLHSNVGQRLKAVQAHLEGEEFFLANYSDGLSDLPLPEYIEQFKATGKVGAFVCVRPPHTSHVVRVAKDGAVESIAPFRVADVWINGGYFVFRQNIFDYLQEGEELVREPFERLIAEGKLFGYKYSGFWKCIDTFKEKQELDELHARGSAPWQVWQNRASSTADSGG